MDKRLRRMAIAYVVALTLLALTTPATAAQAKDTSASFALIPMQLLDELMSWLAGWLDESPVQSISAQGSHAMDLAGAPSPSLSDGSTVTTDGGVAMDPNG